VKTEHEGPVALAEQMAEDSEAHADQAPPTYTKTNNDPLARQILLQARALADANPRASLVLAVAAAEVGLKRFAVESSAPSEGWLISEIQSPPLPKLTKRYVPFLPDKRTTEEGNIVPKSLHKALDQAAEARNDVVHQAEAGFDEQRLAKLLVVVNDFLYLLDWFTGHEWAFGHLQEETEQAYRSA
jgi:hypothetical protein